MTSIITKDVNTSSQKKLLEIAAAHAKHQRSADEQTRRAPRLKRLRSDSGRPFGRKSINTLMVLRSRLRRMQQHGR
jgi:hypothetical protein